MDVVFRLQNLEFEWDDQKAARNFDKHGVSFAEAAEAFLDPFFQIGDATVDERETREFVLGYSQSSRLLLVVYVERGVRTRIISARLATRAERKLYEES